MSLFLLHMIDKSATGGSCRDSSRTLLLYLVLFASISVRSEICYLVWKRLINFRPIFFFSQGNHIFFPWNLFCPLLQHFPTHQSLTLLPFTHWPVPRGHKSQHLWLLFLYHVCSWEAPFLKIPPSSWWKPLLIIHVFCTYLVKISVP